MIKVAVIGGIGSGKSFIAKLFKYPVFNADDLAQYSLIRLSPRDFIIPVFSLKSIYN